MMVGHAITDQLIIFRFVHLVQLVLISSDIVSSLKLITIWLKNPGGNHSASVPNNIFSRKCKSYFSATNKY